MMETITWMIHVGGLAVAAIYITYILAHFMDYCVRTISMGKRGLLVDLETYPQKEDVA